MELDQYVCVTTLSCWLQPRGRGNHQKPTHRGQTNVIIHMTVKKVQTGIITEIPNLTKNYENWQKQPTKILKNHF